MSQIQIEVLSVSAPQTVPTSTGRSYQTIEVAYKKDGKIEGKKLMSFSNPSVFKTAQSLNTGSIAYVTTEKNDKGYWQWESISTEASAPVHSAPAATSNSNSSAGSTKSFSNYETKEERQQRQVMIVRQSSLSNAVATLAVGAKAIKADDVINLAKQYEAYVLSTESSALPSLNEMEDDIPL